MTIFIIGLLLGLVVFIGIPALIFPKHPLTTDGFTATQNPSEPATEGTAIGQGRVWGRGWETVPVCLELDAADALRHAGYNDSIRSQLARASCWEIAPGRHRRGDTRVG